MFHTHPFHHPLAVAPGALLVAVLFGVGSASAQPIERGHERTLRMMAQQQARTAPRYSSRAPVSAPGATAPRYVSIVGPDGRVRIFEIEGPIVVVPRDVVVRYGTDQFVYPAP